MNRPTLWFRISRLRCKFSPNRPVDLMLYKSNTSRSFFLIDMLMWKESKQQIKKDPLEKNKVGGPTLPDSRLNCKATVIQSLVILCILKMKLRCLDSLPKSAF